MDTYMIGLIDMDSLVYKSGFSKEKDFVQTIELLEGMVSSLSRQSECTENRLIL